MQSSRIEEVVENRPRLAVTRVVLVVVVVIVFVVAVVIVVLPVANFGRSLYEPLAVPSPRYIGAE